MKRAILFLLLIGLMTAFSGAAAWAAAPLTTEINGSEVNAPADINIEEGQAMIPVRWAAEQLGASSVQWDTKTRTITIKTPQDFYNLEKYDSYVRGLQIGSDEQESQIWPLPEKIKNLKLSDDTPERDYTLELAEKSGQSAADKASGPICITITSEDGTYQHSSMLYSAENRQGHYYLPMDWLEYLFDASVSYDDKTNLLSIKTPDIAKIKADIAVIENALVPSSADEALKLWGRGEQTRNGALQYAALSPALRLEADKSSYVHESYWVTGFSSPWMGPITITSRKEQSSTQITYTISYPEITSSPPNTTGTETLVIEKILNNGQEGWYITQIVQSGRLRDPQLASSESVSGFHRSLHSSAAQRASCSWRSALCRCDKNIRQSRSLYTVQVWNDISGNNNLP